MNCIGEKSFAFVIHTILEVVLLLVAIMFWITSDDESAAIMIAPILFILGVMSFSLYYLIFVPKEIVSYDSSTNMVKVCPTRKIVKDIHLSEIQKIEVDRPHSRATWVTCAMLLKNGEVITANGISLNNEIIDTLMVIKK